MTSISPPVYEQIAQAIRRQILDGDLPPGSRLPSESILCERFSVTRGTVRRALQVLTHEGHLRSYQGKGTFVTAQDDKRILWGFGSLTDRLQGSSDQARARVIEHGVVTRQNRPFLRLKRLRLIESNTVVFPVSLDLSFIPIDLLPGIQDVDFTDLSICVTSIRALQSSLLSHCVPKASTKKPARSLANQRVPVVFFTSRALPTTTTGHALRKAKSPTQLGCKQP